MIADLWAVLTRAGIRLDEAERAALGGPSGTTISVWAAMEARHGNAFAHVVCLALWLVQFRHCADQIADVPMRPGNYVRAVLLLIPLAPVAALIWAVRKLL